MRVKIRASMLTKWPIWRVFDENNVEVGFWDREHKEFKGLTKPELEKILIKKGYQIK